jgi:hypothetical protein
MLTRAVTVEVMNEDGSETADVLAVTLYPLGDRAGVLLDIQTIPDLGEGESRGYRLQVRWFGFLKAETMFFVDGLPEWTVGDGEVAVGPLSRRYSQVDIAGSVRVTDGTLSIESTGSVTITGEIDASGFPGANGTDRTCGGLPPGEDEDRCGAAGGSDGRGGLGLDSASLRSHPTVLRRDLHHLTAQARLDPRAAYETTASPEPSLFKNGTRRSPPLGKHPPAQARPGTSPLQGSGSQPVVPRRG